MRGGRDGRKFLLKHLHILIQFPLMLVAASIPPTRWPCRTLGGRDGRKYLFLKILLTSLQFLQPVSSISLTQQPSRMHGGKVGRTCFPSSLL
jgi:hypothetical protein